MNTRNHPQNRLALARTAIADGRLRAAERHLDAAAGLGAPATTLREAQEQVNSRRATERAIERLAQLQTARLQGVQPPPAVPVRDREVAVGEWRITRHVVDRWRERVGRSEDVAHEIREMLERGRLTGRQPRWATNRHRPGSRYVVWHERPGVALVVSSDRAVTTVLTRSRRGSV
jgi:hypothetical protein